MARDGATPEAKLNLQRALAIDDASMPAYDQLAQWYLKTKRLDLAALVCSQAIKRDASYAPIHNTAGLVESAQGRVNGALAEFTIARRLDPKLFEAHMNYANVNLGSAPERRWQGFPVVTRELDHYEGLAGAAGLEVEAIGALHELGHVSGDARSDAQVMLRFTAG